MNCNVGYFPKFDNIIAVLTFKSLEMAFSKPIYAPKKWAEKAKGVTSMNEEKQLVGMDELINWVTECELAGEATVRKYWDTVRPYHFMRCLYPVFPDNILCKEFFKVLLHASISIYIADDQLEKQSREEAKIACAAHARIDQQSTKRFPNLPTIQEMKQILSTFSTPSIVGPTTMFADFGNRLAKVLLLHGNWNGNVVADFRLRNSNLVSMYFQAIQAEKTPNKKNTTLETLWRRIFGGVAVPYSSLAEIASGAIRNSKQHIAVITDMHLLSGLFATTINDLYSYFLEKSSICDNVVAALLHEKTAENVSEAVDKVAQILDAILKLMYKKAEQIKLQFPDNRELRDFFDYVGQVTVGWYYLHECALPRYQGSPWRVHLEEIDEDEIPKWLSEKGKYGSKVMQELMELVQERMADGKMDAVHGKFPINEKYVAEKEDGLYKII